jgi:mono/diheme cytochrome c family protein
LAVALSKMLGPATSAGVFGALLLLVLAIGHAGDIPAMLGLHTGREIYQAACAACHGEHGEGTPTVMAGFDQPSTMPHFNKCNESLPEYTRDYKAVILQGGTARGFSHIMPSFSGVLTPQQVDAVVKYLRAFCHEPGWAPGELNVPRAIATEKAFPESETVLTSKINTQGPAGVSNELVHEQILSQNNQLEVAVPFEWARQDNGGSAGGLGDIAVGLKHVLLSRFSAPDDAPDSEGTGDILSVQGEVLLPTGSWHHGFGYGEPALGLFAAYDRLLPARTFLQLQGGVEAPLHAEHAPRSAYLRSAFGRTFTQGQWGRLWTPILEVTGTRDLTAGATTDYDVLPELQVTLSRRQHVIAAVGYDIPVNDTTGRPRQIALYVLWDWFDGRLLEGWK